MLEPVTNRFDRRLTGAALALLFECLLVLVVVSMAYVDHTKQPNEARLTSVALRDNERDARPEPKQSQEAAKPLQQAKSNQPELPHPPEISPTAAPTAPAIIPLSKNQMSSFDISKLPRDPAPAKPMMGPVNTGVAGDSKRVGLAPNGQPMYGAAWYREPSDDELRGYLSTADPGWALIACRTAADFRVEDCEPIDEYPTGSHLLRAVLAASWQFRVRPPRVGGVSQVGAWVRIRIEYSQKRN